MKNFFLSVVLCLICLGMGANEVVSVSDQANKYKYVGSEKCKMCHKIQYESWQKTNHAAAWNSLTEKEKQDKKCVSCHSVGENQEFLYVGCESCHGPGSEYSKLSVMKDKEKSKAAGLIASPDEKVCVRCHNNQSPNYKGFDFKERVKKVHEHKK